MSGTIKLNVINQTADIAAANVVLCQHNAGAGLRANPIAWQVLRNIGRQESRPFELPHEFEVQAIGPEGDATPKVSSRGTQAFALTVLEKGPVLTRVKAPGRAEKGVELRNLQEAGDARVHVYKLDRLLALQTDVVPGETASFQFHPHVYIGIAAQIQEGAIMSFAAASRVTARINLHGVRAADIVLSSSDKGPNAPLFRLENIQ